MILTQSPVELGAKSKEGSNDLTSGGDLGLSSCISQPEMKSTLRACLRRAFVWGKERPEVLIFSLYLKGNV